MNENQKAAVMDVVLILGEIIRELKEIPSGHLYARLMNKMSLETYNALLGIMEKAGWIRIKSHVIYWTGN